MKPNKDAVKKSMRCKKERSPSMCDVLSDFINYTHQFKLLYIKD